MNLAIFRDSRELRGPDRNYRTFMQAQFYAALSLGLMKTLTAPLDVAITRQSLPLGRLRDVYEVGACRGPRRFELTAHQEPLQGAQRSWQHNLCSLAAVAVVAEERLDRHSLG
jgi:hypothetical protein